MEGKDLNLTVDTTALTNAVEAGIQTQEQAVSLNRLVRSVLAIDLLKGARELSSTIDPLMRMYERAKARFEEVFEEEVDSYGTKEALELMDAFSSVIMRIVDLQRKIVQGKELFSSQDLMTEEERAVSRLMQSIQTPEEKKVFIETMKKVILETKQKKDPAESDDFEG